MSEIKTKENNYSVHDFINSFANNEQKRKDGFEILELMSQTSGFEAKMWGPSIIGFGKFHYKSERSKQQGDWPIVGFSPRKAAISLYVYCGTKQQDLLLTKLGKFKMGKVCIYVNKLADIDQEVLKELVSTSVEFIKEKYGILE